MSAPSGVLEEAYAHCEAVTRRAAGNFYYGIRLLPAEKRRAMCATYAYARRVDDIGDGALPEEEKRARLDAQARALRELERADGDLVMVALADARRRFALPLDAALELIDGVRMDVGAPVFEREEELLTYCRHVAGSIGRMCVAIFGCRDASAAARAPELADHIGVGMQITNILRDLREDAELGRVYLPVADLVRFELIERDGGAAPQAVLELAHNGTVGGSNGAGAMGERFERFVRFEAARAHEWFSRGMPLVELLDRRSAACVLAMTGIYRRVLERIEGRPEQLLRERVSLAAPEKAWVAARSMLGASR